MFSISDNFVDNASMSDIPNKTPVILFLLDNESALYHENYRLVRVFKTHGETQAAIAGSRGAKFCCVTPTTDLASADYSLLDHFIVGVQRSDKLHLSLETVYMWRDSDGTPYTTATVKFNRPDDLLGAILDGSVF